jgi:hypothetical protein
MSVTPHKPPPAGMALVVVDTPDSTAVVQAGHPTAQMSAYFIDMPADLDSAVQNFIASQNFPTNSNVYAVADTGLTSYAWTVTLVPNA